MWYQWQRVICRFRPVNEREKSEAARKDVPTLEFPDDFTVVVKVPKSKPAIYQFDRVFYSPATTQKEVYDLAAKDTIEDVIAGYNGTIFAYGQTGAGKSFSMSGADVTSPETKGIIPRSCDHLFSHIAADTSGTEYTIKCSFLEIYKENIHDLLDPDSGGNLKVRETPSRGVWVQGLSEHFVTSVEDIIDLLQAGEKYRAVSATSMNAVSSRSHSLFILSFIQRNQDGSTKEGKLNLADLAGSEKVGKTGASGETLEEAKKINQSLSALGNCINALTKAKRGHVPYRDSKLTHILRESLGGNSKTTLLIACSPHSFNVEETISTLKFGQRAKTIKNSVRVNQQRSVKELEAIIDNLTRELAHLKAYSEMLEKDLLKLDPNYDLAGLRKKLAAQLAAAQQAAEAASKESVYDDENPPSSPTDDEADTTDTCSAPDSPGDSKTPSTPVRALNDSPLIPGTPLVHFDTSYDPMALAEAQLQIQQMKERYELRLMDLKDEVSRLSSENKEYEENMQQAQQYILNTKKEMDSVKAELGREREDSQLRNSSAEYEAKRKLLEAETAVSNLTEAKSNLQTEVDKLKASNAQAKADCEAAKDEKDALDKKLKAAQADAQRWKLRVDSGAADAAKKEAVLQKKRADEADARAKALDKELQNLKVELELASRRAGEYQVELDKSNQEKEVLERSLSSLAPVTSNPTTSTEASTSGSLVRSNSQISLDPNAVGELATAQRKIIELNSALQKADIEKKDNAARTSQQTKLLEEAQNNIRVLQEVIANNDADNQERSRNNEALLKEAEDAVQIEKEAREAAEIEVRNLKRQLATAETSLESSKDLLDRTQRETQQAASNMTKQMDQASARVKELETQVESLHERNVQLQSRLDDSVENFARMSAELSDQLKQEQQTIMQLRSTMSRTHRAGSTGPGARRAPSNIPKQIKGGQGLPPSSNNPTDSPSQPKGFMDWLFGRDPLPNKDQLAGAQLAGALWKQTGIFKTWKQQWFVLKGHKLFYFPTKESTQAEGYYHIGGCSANTRRDVEPSSEYRYQFTVNHPSRKTIYLCALNAREMSNWIEAIDELASCTRVEAEIRVITASQSGVPIRDSIEEGMVMLPASNVTTPGGPTQASSSNTPIQSQGTPYKAPQSVKVTPAVTPTSSSIPTKTTR